MSASGPIDLFVDIEKLTDLGREIQSLLQSFDGLDHTSGPDSMQMGSHDVASALQRFDRNWQQGRQQLVEHLSDALKLVELAVDRYQFTENNLESSVAAPVPVSQQGAQR